VTGLDESIAALAAHGSLAAVLAVAILLGIRHATDPDHVAALAALTAADHSGGARGAGLLGLAWGLGHGVSLVGLGLPFVLLGAQLPDPVQRGAEAAVGLVIVALAVHLLRRWRQARFHVHVHTHPDGIRHAHVHAHESSLEHAHEHRPRSPRAAFAIGLLHGAAGSAAVGVLLVASISSRAVAATSLGLLALGTAATMATLSSGFGLALVRAHRSGAVAAVTPCLGVVSLAFGGWYFLGAL
jgi:ABC-type nickel/cobalt efflux system permease component RcnA